MIEGSTKTEIKTNLTSEEKQNMVNFFDLLLKVDRRINPDLYNQSRVIINPLLWEEEVVAM